MRLLVWARATFFSLAGVTLSLVSSSLAGGESSAGADDYRVQAAWFRSADPQAVVKGCFEIRKGFGVSASKIETMILEAFRLWGEYPAEKKLVGPEAIWIAKRLVLKARCRGGEDLAFYLGVDRPEIRKTKKRYRHPFGFVEMTASDQPAQPLWGRGYVWIVEPFGFGRLNAPDWSSSEGSLAALILHEVGHVFGNGHVDGTVMTPKIGQYLEADTALYRSGPSFLERYDRIDSERELVDCLFCPTTYESDRDKFDVRAAYKELIGKVPTGQVSMNFKRMASPPADAILVVRDEKGSHSLRVRISAKIAEFEDGAPCFSGLYGKTYRHRGASFYATIRTPAGKDVPVALNSNFDGRKLAIRRLNELMGEPLFVSGR